MKNKRTATQSKAKQSKAKHSRTMHSQETHRRAKQSTWKQSIAEYRKTSKQSHTKPCTAHNAKQSIATPCTANQSKRKQSIANQRKSEHGKAKQITSKSLHRHYSTFRQCALESVVAPSRWVYCFIIFVEWMNFRHAYWKENQALVLWKLVAVLNLCTSHAIVFED